MRTPESPSVCAKWFELNKSVLTETPFDTEAFSFVLLQEKNCMAKCLMYWKEVTTEYKNCEHKIALHECARREKRLSFPT